MSTCTLGTLSRLYFDANTSVLLLRSNFECRTFTCNRVTLLYCYFYFSERSDLYLCHHWLLFYFSAISYKHVTSDGLLKYFIVVYLYKYSSRHFGFFAGNLTSAMVTFSGQKTAFLCTVFFHQGNTASHFISASADIFIWLNLVSYFAASRILQMLLS